jgi:small subunit ribosomal protein S6
LRDITNRAPRNYELMTILHPEVTEEELPGALEQVAGYITAADGTIEETLRDSPWGRRRLAYPIRHGGRDLRDGFYTVYHLHLAPNRVEEVERELKLNERVMRYLMTSYEPIPVDPKVLEQQEYDAEDAAAAAYTAAQVAATRAAAEAARTASAEAQTEAAVATADSDATDAAATVAANEAVDLPVDAESARIADDAEAVAESPAAADDVAEAAEAELVAVGDEATASDAAADAVSNDAGTGAGSAEAVTEAGAAPSAGSDDSGNQSPS